MSPVTTRGLRPGKTQTGCSATETSKSFESLNLERRGIILSRQRITTDQDAQADMHLCCSHMAKTGFLMTWIIYISVYLVLIVNL